MLIWMCALRCEAKPVIDRYRLKKTAEKPLFDLYSGDDMACVVSGIGLDNMARAVDWTARRFTAFAPLRWINLGIAGDAYLAVGSLAPVSQYRLEGHKDRIDAMLILDTDLASRPVTSYTSEQHVYPPSSMTDMEAWAFINHARLVSPLQYCHCIKVISDTPDSPAIRDKSRISQLIAGSMETIATLADSMSSGV